MASRTYNRDGAYVTGPSHIKLRYRYVIHSHAGNVAEADVRGLPSGRSRRSWRWRFPSPARKTAGDLLHSPSVQMCPTSACWR